MHHQHHKHNFEDFAIGYLIGRSSAGSPQQQVSHDNRGWLGWAIFFTVVSSLLALFVGPLMWPGGLDIFQIEPLFGIFVLVLAFIICGLPFVLVLGIIVALIDERKFDAEMLRQSQESQQKIDRLVQEGKKKQEIVDAKKADLRAMLEAKVDVEAYLLKQVNADKMTYVERRFYSDWSTTERRKIDHEILMEKCREVLKDVAQEDGRHES